MGRIASLVRQRIGLFVALGVVLALGRAVPAAAQNTSGAIAGTITDTQGGRAAGCDPDRHQLG